MAILVQPGSQPEEVVKAIGGRVGVVETLSAADRALAKHPDEQLVVVGPDVDMTSALSFTEHQRTHRHHVGVVLVRDHIDVQVLTQALQSGVREVVPADAVGDLGAACQRSLATSSRLTSANGGASEGKVVTVFAAKGGCGKTTVAVNLALALAQGGRHSVCLIDLDLAFGDVAITLQLDPARTITDAVPMLGRIDETGAKSLLTPYRPCIETLLAPVTPGDAEKVPATLVSELLTVLKGMFDYVVVDTPSQFSEHVLNAMDAAKFHVLLTTPDVPALKNLRLTLDMLDLLSYPREACRVVLNRSDAKVGLTADDVQRVVRGPIAVHVPSSRDVPVSINKGLPIVTATPNHPVSQAISGLAHELLAAGAPVPTAQHRKGGAFGRLRAGRR